MSRGISIPGIRRRPDGTIGDERRERIGVARGEECHVVPATHEFVGECRDDALRAAILQWWHTFG